ncbi:MAG: hydroxypyruvate isomerase, partial [Mesorhizobium sp.]
AELQAAVAFALPYAEATGVKRLHLMSGLAAREDRAAVDTYRKAIIWTAGKLADRGIDLVIEPINGRDMPGYFLNDFDFAEQLIGELALPNLKLQFDVYHRQILHGDVVMALRRLLPIIG